MVYNLQYKQYNSYSILIEWKSIIDENILHDIIRFKSCIENKYVKDKVEVINTYNSLLIIYGYTIDNVNDKVLSLKSLYFNQNEAIVVEPSLWKIPVCYDCEFAIDLNEFSVKKELSESEIIKRHSQVVYTVFFIGFLPGFLYLGGLDSTLNLDRKTTPSLNVKKGSVAIGGNQTGIYPQDSPGGWYIIGNSPIELFNRNQNPPCFIKAGDKIKFHPITISEYFEIKLKTERLAFDYKSLKA